MPLVSIKAELVKARSRGYALPLFNVFELSGAEDFVATAEELKAPVMFGFYAGFLSEPRTHRRVRCARALAEQSTMPVSIMLDHGSCYEQCRQALDMGISDVMFDGSKLTYEENRDISARVAELAHQSGGAAEAELGHVGVGRTYDQFGARRAGFTDPQQAKRFVEETGVDILAVAVGTAHGVYKGKPSLDLALLEKIADMVPIPLALHGGSGLSEEQFTASIRRGIAKINIATDIVHTMFAEMKAVATQKEDTSFFELVKPMHAVMEEKTAYYCTLFDAVRKA